MNKVACSNCGQTIIRAGYPGRHYWYHVRSQTVWCVGNRPEDVARDRRRAAAG